MELAVNMPEQEPQVDRAERPPRYFLIAVRLRPRPERIKSAIQPDNFV